MDNRKTEECKLWIGNLDPRITEYQLLKLVQIYGTIEKFDLIFHRSGPLAGQPRGYAFVTYVKREDAFKAKEKLNGKMVGHKKITVTWAHNADLINLSSTKSKCDIVIPALAISKDSGKTDKISQIQAIEAKLRLMEQKKDELQINDSIATKSSMIQQFQFNKDKLCYVPKHFSSRGTDRCKKPYIKKKP